ncbi:hypothetical protein OAD66_02440, partial [Bacteroidia bacterium]|nr:hypothetical protein [Bacteroidia bacterium]
AKPLLVWALYFFLNRLKIYSFLLIGFATLFQPLMGFQMFVLIGLSDLICNRNTLSSVKNTIAYLLAGGWLFAVMIISYFSGISDVEIPQLFEIYFGFRAPHHFLPSYFMGAYSYVFFLVLGLALFYFYDRLPEIFWFLIILFGGCVVYAVGVEVFHSTTIASTQWFKVTQWAKIFLLLFLFDKARPLLKSFENYIPKPWIVLGGFVSLVVIIFLYRAPGSNPLNKPNDLVQKSSNSLMYEYVKNYTHVDACFVIPFQNSDFKYGAMRSVYVDFKSVDPRSDFMMLWKPRMDAVYGVPNLDIDKGFNYEVKANKYYKALNSNDFLSLKKGGVTHMLTKWPITNSALKLAWNNDVYYIYEYQ